MADKSQPKTGQLKSLTLVVHRMNKFLLVLLLFLIAGCGGGEVQPPLTSKLWKITAFDGTIYHTRDSLKWYGGSSVTSINFTDVNGKMAIVSGPFRVDQ